MLYDLYYFVKITHVHRFCKEFTNFQVELYTRMLDESYRNGLNLSDVLPQMISTCPTFCPYFNYITMTRIHKLSAQTVKLIWEKKL